VIFGCAVMLTLQIGILSWLIGRELSRIADALEVANAHRTALSDRLKVAK